MLSIPLYKKKSVRTCTCYSSHVLKVFALPSLSKRATQDGNFGYLGAHLKSAWDQDNAVWEGIKQLGVDSIFVGHEHQNSISVIYQGVRLQYGQKSSAYDRYNSDDNGPIMGGTFFTLDVRRAPRQKHGRREQKQHRHTKGAHRIPSYAWNTVSYARLARFMLRRYPKRTRRRCPGAARPRRQAAPRPTAACG